MQVYYTIALALALKREGGMVNKRVLESLGKQSDLSGTQLPAHHHKTEITKLKEGGIFGYEYGGTNNSKNRGIGSQLWT